MNSLGLEAITTDQGTFAVLAMDQRGTLRRMLAEVDKADATDADMTELKRDMIASLAGSASAFLIDPTYGLPAARKAETTEPYGLLLAAEPAKRGSHDGEPVVSLDPDQDASWVAANGADALKFLVQIRADRPVKAGDRDLTAEAVTAMRTLIADCAAVGIPSIVENLIYPLRGEDPLGPEARADAIIEAAVLLDELKPTVLKLEYPGSPEACRRLAEQLTVPWAVLSAGVASDAFADVLRISCDEGGASGFIAGRSVWRETVAMDHEERVRFLRETGRRRLDEYRDIIAGRARSYREVAA